MRSVEIAHEMPRDLLARLEAHVAQHGPLTHAVLRRAVRDSAILADLERRPGQYEAVGARWGVSEDTVRAVEDAAKKLSRTM